MIQTDIILQQPQACIYASLAGSNHCKVIEGARMKLVRQAVWAHYINASIDVVRRRTHGRGLRPAVCCIHYAATLGKSEVLSSLDRAKVTIAQVLVLREVFDPAGWQESSLHDVVEVRTHFGSRS